MSKEYFLPRSKAGKLQKLVLFAANLPSYVAKYGITVAQKQDMIDSAAYLEYCFHADEATQQYDLSVTQYIDSLMNGIPSGTLGGLPAYVATTPVPAVIPAPGIFDRMIAIVNIIKANPAYVIADGQNMGIEGADHHIDENALRPDLKVEIVSGKAVVSAAKAGTQGFEVWADHGDGNFVFIGFSTATKFIDHMQFQPVAQTWHYKAIYHMHNEQVGNWSNVITISVGL
ncbi:MAG: hypothetical protein RJA07_884 [Bacteroidota bacterium]|jgi:hypothetical protein